MDELKVSTPPTPEEIAQKTTQATNMPLMYFNYVRVASSFFDLRLFLGQGSVTAQGESTFNEELCIAMSLEFAKILRDNLSTTIRGYEEKFGAVRQPPTLGHEVVAGTGASPERKKPRKS